MKNIYVIYKTRASRANAALYVAPLGTGTKADAFRWFKINHPDAVVIGSVVSDK